MLAELADKRCVFVVLARVPLQSIRLECAGHIVGVAEVEALADLDLLEEVNVVRLIRVVLRDLRCPEQGHHFHILHLIDIVISDSRHFLFRRNEK